MICRNHIDVSEGVRRCSRCGSPFCRNCLVQMQNGLFCATCKTEQVLDVRSGVSYSTLEYATIGKRFVGVFLDNLPGTILGFFLGMWYATHGRSFQIFSPITIGIGLIYICYEALMLGSRGQTLGKMAAGVKVVSADGSPISMGQGWGRAFARSLLGWLYIVDYIPAFFTAEKTTIHDMLAKTRVVNV
jgi:uncharacterized RDD family membrane protein YckC